MLSLISEEPDSYNINYYYTKYRDYYSIGMTKLNPSKLYVLPMNINPVTCDTSLTKKYYYLKIPTQPQPATCLCSKYHTNFTSQYYKISPQTILGIALIEVSLIISAKHFNRITDKL